MKRLVPLILAILGSMYVTAQQAPPARPKLVVGIVVDQMRWDYLYRYSNRYVSGGFKRMQTEGFSCENAFIDYTPTYTAAGHASTFTGSVPSLNGIIGNSWYDARNRKFVYCTDDDSVVGVGSSSNAGKMSPKNLWSSTISDELKLAQNFRNKTIAVSLKDRGSILPGGHTADAAYWFDNATGGWITSTFYMKELPSWVQRFNDKKLPDSFLKKNWWPLFPVETYMQSTKDDPAYEDIITGEDNQFPHMTEGILANKYEAFRYMAGANTYTLEMAKAAIENEGLGKSGFTDMLAISFSSTDYAGHRFGPNSIEMEDMYLRLDRDIAAFFQYLDKTVGKGQYLVFLTADHGAAHVPSFAKEHRIPAGVEDDLVIKTAINATAKKELGITDAISVIINYQVYLNTESVKPENMQAVKQLIMRELLALPMISHAFDLKNIPDAGLPNKVMNMVKNGYSPKLSGDIQFIFKSQWFDGGLRGTTHGLWNPYDSHLPLLWFGWKIKPGRTYREVYMSDIAVTLAALLQVQMPNAAVGDVITEIVK